jgi:hypothetical protein
MSITRVIDPAARRPTGLKLTRMGQIDRASGVPAGAGPCAASKKTINMWG